MAIHKAVLEVNRLDGKAMFRLGCTLAKRMNDLTFQDGFGNTPASIASKSFVPIALQRFMLEPLIVR
jgi:hypothetical protein